MSSADAPASTYEDLRDQYLTLLPWQSMPDLHAVSAGIKGYFLNVFKIKDNSSLLTQQLFCDPCDFMTRSFPAWETAQLGQDLGTLDVAAMNIANVTSPFPDPVHVVAPRPPQLMNQNVRLWQMGF